MKCNYKLLGLIVLSTGIFGGIYAAGRPYLAKIVNNSTDESISVGRDDVAPAEFVDIWSPNRNVAVDTFQGGVNQSLETGIEIPALAGPVTQSLNLASENFYNQAIGINTKKRTYFLLYGALLKGKNVIWVYEPNLIQPTTLLKKPYMIPGSDLQGPLALYIAPDGSLQKFESLTYKTYSNDDNW